MLSSNDRDYADFLAWTEIGQALKERFVPDAETLLLARYDAETEEWLKVLRNPPPPLAPRIPALPIPILKYRAIEQAHTNTKTSLIEHLAKAAS